MKKTYYRQAKAHVLPYLKNYTDDFLKHDRIALKGNKGEFILAYRKTGTHLLLIGKEIEALNDILETGNNRGYFTPKGVQNIKKGLYQFSNQFAVQAITHEMQEKWLHGANGKVTPVKFSQVKKLLEQWEKHVAKIIQAIQEKQAKGIYSL